MAKKVHVIITESGSKYYVYEQRGLFGTKAFLDYKGQKLRIINFSAHQDDRRTGFNVNDMKIGMHINAGLKKDRSDWVSTSRIKKIM